MHRSVIAGLAFASISAPRVVRAFQPPLVVSGSGRVFGTTATTTARIGLVSSDALGLLDVSSDASGRVPAALSVAKAMPIADSSSIVVSAAYQGVSRQAAGAVRLEHATATGVGVWAGARAGPARVDSLGLDPWAAGVSTFLMPVRGPMVGGPIGLGAGLWGQRWGATFGASVTTGSAGVKSRRIYQGWATHTVPYQGGDSVQQWAVIDTTATSRTAMTWLGRLSAQWAISRLSVELSGGVVAQPNAPTVGWVGSTASFRLWSPLSLVLGAGTRGTSTTVAVDPRLERAYFTGGLTVGWPAAWTGPRRVGRGGDAIERDVRYRVVARSDSAYGLVIRATWAQTVDVMSDVTDWQPMSCDPARGGEWVLPRPLTPGVHQFLVRVDGGKWIVPAGASRAVSEYGDVVGVIVVGR